MKIPTLHFWITVGVFALVFPLSASANISGTLSGSGATFSSSGLILNTVYNGASRLRIIRYTSGSGTGQTDPTGPTYSFDFTPGSLDLLLMGAGDNDFTLDDELGSMTAHFETWPCSGGDELVFASDGASGCSSSPPPPPPAGGAFTSSISSLFTIASSTCTQTNDPSATTTFYCTATSSQPVGVPYGDWLIMNGLIVFFLGFIAISRMGTVFKFK